MIHPSLAQYLPFVENTDCFLRSLAQSLPVCIWANTVKTSPKSLEEWLDHEGLEWETLAWYPGAYRIYSWDKPGKTLPFICGWYTVQEEIALTAVRALGPRPGDRILDLCASPGGKTAQLSLAVGWNGMVMANERSTGRLAALSATITRMGLTNVLTSGCDGRFLAAPPHSFDRILVDVPCSGEGTIRKKAGRKSLEQRNWSAIHSQRLVTIQRQLLDRALWLVKPGGVVVYSTCTFAPEENEAVIDAVLGDRGVIEPYTIPGLDHAPGIVHWNGQSFRADCHHAHRYWPHLNNTGGFFVARLRRTNQDLAVSAHTPIKETQHLSRSLPPQTTLLPVQDQAAVRWMSDRFGIEYNHLMTYRYWSTGREKKWIASPACVPPENVPVNTIGLPFIRQTPHGFKPTTAALQYLGRHIKQHHITLTSDQRQQFVAGDTQPYNSPEQKNEDNKTQGFMHIRSDLYELGCGRWRNQQLYCELPKSLRLR